jgi:hypothetical protein
MKKEIIKVVFSYFFFLFLLFSMIIIGRIYSKNYFKYKKYQKKDCHDSIILKKKKIFLRYINKF